MPSGPNKVVFQSSKAFKDKLVADLGIFQVTDELSAAGAPRSAQSRWSQLLYWAAVLSPLARHSALHLGVVLSELQSLRKLLNHQDYQFCFRWLNTEKCWLVYVGTWKYSFSPSTVWFLSVNELSVSTVTELKRMEYCPSSKALVKKHILRLIACSWDKEDISIFVSEDECFDPTDFNQV